jgi:hypothetical protein
MLSQLNTVRPALPMRPKFDIPSAMAALDAAIAKRDVALTAFGEVRQTATNGEEALATALTKLDAYDGLSDEIEATFLTQIEAGEETCPTPDQQRRFDERVAADRHSKAVFNATTKIHVKLQTALDAVSLAQATVNRAALVVIQFEGEALAEKAAALRAEFVAALNELTAMSDCRIGESKVPTSSLWFDLISTEMHGVGRSATRTAEWIAKAKKLADRHDTVSPGHPHQPPTIAAPAADQPGDDDDETDAVG